MTNVPNPEALAGQRVLVTGASGFLGSHLSVRLRALGAEVHGVSRSDRSDSPGPTHWWRADIESMDELERLLATVRPTLIYHLSGVVNGAPLPDLLLPTYHSLLTTTVNLLAALTKRSCRRLILIGSLEEGDPTEGEAPPTSPYAAAKTSAREYVRMCHRLFNTPAVLLRTFMSYGPGQPEWKIIPSTIRALFEGVSPALSSGRRRLDWVYVDDVVDAFVAAAVTPEIEGMTLDIGSGHLASIREVVQCLVGLVHTEIEPHFGELPDRLDRPPRAADVTYTLEHLGWQARTPLEEGLRLTVEAYRRQS